MVARSIALSLDEASATGAEPLIGSHESGFCGRLHAESREEFHKVLWDGGLKNVRWFTGELQPPRVKRLSWVQQTWRGPVPLLTDKRMA